MLDRISEAPWSAGDAVAFAVLLVTCVSVGVAAGGLVVSWLTHREARRVERAKLAMQLWERQAQFAAEFSSALRALVEEVAAAGLNVTSRIADRLDTLRSIVVGAAPFLPERTARELRAFVGRVESMFTKAVGARSIRAEGNDGAEAISRHLIEQASEILIELVEGDALANEEIRLRSMLHTDALTDARREALGLGPSWSMRFLRSSRRWLASGWNRIRRRP